VKKWSCAVGTAYEKSKSEADAARGLLSFYYTTMIEAGIYAESGQHGVLPASDTVVSPRDESFQSRGTMRLDAQSPAASAAAKTT
jgi:hypothetical protein